MAGKDLIKRIGALAREERAVTATEYAIMLALIVLGSMAIIRTIGEDFENVYLAIANGLPSGSS